MRTVNRLALGVFALGWACTEPETVSPTAQVLSSTGTIAVEVTTTGAITSAGADIDADGYTAWLDFSHDEPVAPNGVATFSGVGPGYNGNHTVGLYGIASNCSVNTLSDGASNPRTVFLREGAAASTDFSIGCVPSGGLTIRTNTTGVDLPSAYTVTVNGSSRPIAPNDMVTFTEVVEGEQTVAISDIPANCALTDPSSRTVTIVPGTTASASFSASCGQTGSGNGSLTVTTASTGSNLPTGYTVTIGGTVSQAIDANGSSTVAVPAGSNFVTLSAVPSNCTVSGDNPRSVDVPADGSSGILFDVACRIPQPRVSGSGQLGMVSRTGQIFAVDLRADLTGVFSFTDSSTIHPSGLPASIFTDATRDPETSILAYRNTSSACGDPSRGAEFDAMGRLDEGILRFYTVQMCDNGAAGTGTDFISFFIPGEGYGRSGVVTSGDIAKN